MARGGRAAAGAAEGIIAKAARALLRNTDDAAARGARRAAGRSAARTAGRRAATEAGQDAGRAAGRRSLREGMDSARDRARRLLGRSTTRDPIDVASGEVVLAQTDVELPGVLPLVLERTHVSSWRAGGWFGLSWASTLDQRLEVDADGVCYSSPDGLVLVYPPLMMPGIALLPEEGPRLPLRLEPDGGYTLTEPRTGRTLRFPALGGRFGATLPLAAVTDRNGNRVDIDYDEAGAVTGVRHSGGYRIDVETADGRVTALRLLDTEGDGQAGGHVLVRYGYDEYGNLTEVINSSGRPQRFSYDPSYRMTGWIDRNGYEYRYTYDERGRAIAGRGSGGFLDATLTYSEDGRTTVVADSLGHPTTYYLNEARQVVAETNPLGHTTWSEWDRYDRLLTHTDPLGRVTRYAYDESGNVTAVTRPDGSQVTTAYNDLGLPVTVTQPDGAIWRQAYDERGNLTAVTDPLGATTSYAYDERGGLVAITDPLGAVSRVQTNATGLPVAVTDPLGNTTHYARDAFGRVSAITDPLGGVTRLGWTTEGRPAWRASPDGAVERWTYDGEGNLVEYTDAIGQITRMENTHFDLPSAETGPDGARLEFAYDLELRLTAVTNPQGLVWRYEYDAGGTLIRETDFNGRVLAYRHDAAGRLTERTNGAGQTIHYTRDPLGNVIEQRSTDATATFTYDSAGRLVRAVNADADVSMQRDPLGRVVAETCNGRTVSSAFDAAGRRVRRRTPSGAESIWDYDAAGRPITLHTGGQTMRFGYDPAGRETARYIGPQVALTQRWDPAHRLVDQALWTAAPPPDARQARLLRHRAYRYRADGYVTAIHDQATGTRTYDLDPAGRVTAVRGSGWTERYAYDAAGNLTNANWPIPNTASSTDADALGGREYSGTLIRRAGNIRYEHDSQGRVVLRQHKTPSAKPLTWRYTWNSDDRLIAVTTPDGQHWRYRYDPLGRRIAKQRLAADHRRVIEQVDFVWSGMLLMEQAHTVRYESGFEVSGSLDTRITAWEWLPGTFRPICQAERISLDHARQRWIDQQFYAIVTDLIGTPAELIEPTGGIAWQTNSSLWGSQPDLSREEVSCPLRFPGQYHDPETGLNYNHHRYYEPATARYETNDPLGLAAAPNPLTYVRNPLSWLDPLGLAPYIFRGMRESGGVPELGQSARTLGARPGTDIPVDANGMVHPRTGGVSASPDSPTNLPPHRRPPEFGGTGRDPVWQTSSEGLPDGLTYRPDPANPSGHGFIEPSRSMSIEEYQGLLGSTQGSWQLTSPGG
ncbi:MAG TPA: DUF6531 domain-containing protein [Streptosporangiaceae bacterium]|nr:DUF6531 domain-containing protein [Streptosporangiaceae bacterium]